MTLLFRVRLSKPVYLVPIAPGVVIAICLLSSAIWVLTDRQVWWWDQALYGDWTLRLWQEGRVSGIGAWASALIHALGAQQPLTTWLGQFFVPLRHLTGDFESAMLFLNVLAAGGTLALVYYLARHLGANAPSSLAGIMVCGGSGLFIGLTHEYLVEMTQCFTAALMMVVGWTAEKRSPTRTLALALAVVALSFLAKSSSMTFVLPMLTYISVALWASPRNARPALQRMDVLLLLGAVLIAVLAATWYAVHWQIMAPHFVDATTADFALHWGSPVNLRFKLSYWGRWFLKSLSPFPILSACMLTTVAMALVISIIRLFKRPPGEWAKGSVEDGTMFALALAGTVIATIFVFSLQINEDVRFLLPLMPMTGVLIAWSLSIIRIRMVGQIFFVALAINAAINHAYAHGRDPFHIAAAPYLRQVDRNTTAKDLLTETVRSTCGQQSVNRPNLIVVSYATLNVNSINFYSEKESYISGHRCSYTSYNSFDPDVQHALEVIRAVRPAYIVTVAPERQPLPDFANMASRPVTEHLALDPRYRLVSDSGSYVLIYREVDPAD
jgi:hypothetical protein